MIIELRRYNEIGELLIENGTTGSQAQVSYLDVGWEASVTRVAVCMGVKEMGMQTGQQGTYNWPPSQDREQVWVQALWSSQIMISIQYDKNRWENKEGWNPKVPGPLAKWLADEVAPVACACVIITCCPRDLGRPLHL